MGRPDPKVIFFISCPSMVKLLRCWFSNCDLDVVADLHVGRSDTCGDRKLFCCESIALSDFVEGDFKRPHIHPRQNTGATLGVEVREGQLVDLSIRP